MGGVAIFLLVVLAVMIGAGFFMVGGGGAVRAFRERRAPRGEHRRSAHRIAEPTEEHAVGYGVGGEYGSDPQPARVPERPEPEGDD